jgi:hypothetical protein
METPQIGIGDKGKVNRGKTCSPHEQYDTAAVYPVVRTVYSPTVITYSVESLKRHSQQRGHDSQ